LLLIAGVLLGELQPFRGQLQPATLPFRTLGPLGPISAFVGLLHKIRTLTHGTSPRPISLTAQNASSGSPVPDTCEKCKRVLNGFDATALHFGLDLQDT